MKTVQRSIDIASSPEALFDFVMDAQRASEWVPGMREVHGVQGDENGREYDGTWRMAGVDLDVHSRTVVAERPSRIVVRTNGDVTSEWTYAIMRTPIGARLTLHVAYEIPDAVMGRVADDQLLHRNVREVEMSLENLRDLVEHETGALV